MRAWFPFGSDWSLRGTFGSQRKGVKRIPEMLANLGPEFEILRNIPLDDIRRVSGSRIAEGISRLRNGQVERIPGFDGEYGVIRLFSSEELNNTEGQMSFFDLLGVQESGGKQPGGGEPET